MVLMSKILDELELLEINGFSYKDLVEFLYQIYLRDLKNNELKLNGLKIHSNYKKIFIDGKEYRFWHIIERENKKIRERLIDYQRAKRIHWIRPIIESCFLRSDIFVWQSKEVRIKRNGKRKKITLTKIWFKKGEYFIILEKRKTSYILKTAYKIDDWKKDILIKEYNSFLKKNRETQ
jgi:hypothetical protein